MEVVTPHLEFEFEVALDAFTLEVALTAAPGETVVLVGPSGSGKSTCLRSLAGLARPRSGHIRLAGQTMFNAARRIDLPPWKRRVGVVFQDYALFPHLTAERNVLFGLRGVPDARARTREWLEALELTDLAQRKPHQLSGGQQQRVALARAAATDSDLLLLDEPFGALDAATRRSVRGELRRFLQRATGKQGDRPPRATVLVSHDYLDALTLGDRIAVLEAGRLTQIGTRDEVLRRPRTPFLAALTAHNMLEGHAQPNVPGSDLREVTVGTLVLHVAGAADLPSGPVFLSFGPQEVTLLRASTGGDMSPRNQFPALVREIIPLPDRLRIYLDAGVPLIADVVRTAAAELRLEEGAQVAVAVKSTAIEVYR
jgi:molybdate transport system ATP-binding protein